MDSTRFNHSGMLLAPGEEDWSDEVFEEEEFDDEGDVFEDEWDDEGDADEDWEESDDAWGI